MENPALIICDQERTQLLEWIAAFDPPDIAVRNSLARLREELKTADIRSNADMPTNVVRLNSTVDVDMPTGRRNGMRLVPHDQADLKQGRISILSVLGSALIGYPAGATIKWQMPKGEVDIHLVNVVNDPDRVSA